MGLVENHPDHGSDLVYLFYEGGICFESTYRVARRFYAFYEIQHVKISTYFQRYYCK